MDEELTMTGGGTTKSFVTHMTTITTEDKSTLLNGLQYLVLFLIPLVIFNDLLLNNVSDVREQHTMGELSLELLLQLVLFVVVLFMIHRFILFVPTYSGVDYSPLESLCLFVSLLFVLIVSKNQFSEKLNKLRRKVYIYLGLEPKMMEMLHNPEHKEKNVQPNKKVMPQNEEQPLPEYETNNNNSVPEEKNYMTANDEGYGNYTPF